MQANVSLRYSWSWLAAPRKIIYQHNSAYEREDGVRRRIDFIKTFLARMTPGIANSRYTASATGAKYVVFNAYDDALFRNMRSWQSRDRDIVFVGRLVSQKGCDTLLHALDRLRRHGLTPSLTIIGDGEDREKLGALVNDLSLQKRVQFLGIKRGDELARLLNRHRIIAVPSNCEEPFGIVALEGLACGCLPVVSVRGGLVDAIGIHGYTFTNGDSASLADRLAEVLGDLDAAHTRLQGSEVHLSRYKARDVAKRYLDIFKSHCSGVQK